jgi:hypothetical protein
MERVGDMGTGTPWHYFFWEFFFLFILGTYIGSYLGKIHTYLRIGNVPSWLYTGTGTYKEYQYNAI